MARDSWLVRGFGFRTVASSRRAGPLVARGSWQDSRGRVDRRHGSLSRARHLAPVASPDRDSRVDRRSRSTMRAIRGSFEDSPRVDRRLRMSSASSRCLARAALPESRLARRPPVAIHDARNSWLVRGFAARRPALAEVSRELVSPGSCGARRSRDSPLDRVRARERASTSSRHESSTGSCWVERRNPHMRANSRHDASSPPVTAGRTPAAPRANRRCPSTRAAIRPRSPRRRRPGAPGHSP